MAGRTLDGYVSERVIQNLIAIDAADEVAVFVREIPSVAAADAVKAVVEEVDLIAVEDGIATTVDINLSAGQPHLTAVAQVLVVLGAILRFASGSLVVSVFEPEVVLVRHDILRGHRKACHQGEAKSKQSGFHKAMILRVKQKFLYMLQIVCQSRYCLMCFSSQRQSSATCCGVLPMKTAHSLCPWNCGVTPSMALRAATVTSSRSAGVSWSDA